MKKLEDMNEKDGWVKIDCEDESTFPPSLEDILFLDSSKTTHAGYYNHHEDPRLSY